MFFFFFFEELRKNDTRNRWNDWISEGRTCGLNGRQMFRQTLKARREFWGCISGLLDGALELSIFTDSRLVI